MDLAIEKSETSRREVHERIAYMYAFTNTYVYARTSMAGHLLVMSYFVPRRTAHGDYRLAITSVCLGYLYHLHSLPPTVL